MKTPESGQKGMHDYDYNHDHVTLVVFNGRTLSQYKIELITIKIFGDMNISIVVVRCDVVWKPKRRNEGMNAEDSNTPLSPSVSALLVLNKSSNDD